MDENTCIGQFVSSKTTATFDIETGYWTVISDVQEGRQFIDIPWRFKNIAVKSIDKDLVNAQETVVKSLMRKLKDLDGNLWNLPEDENDVFVPNIFEDIKNSTT